MFAVIFRASVADLDDQYFKTAEQMRRLALENYGCLEFISMKEGDQEIAISYWETEEAIQAWKKDSEHLAAQQKGIDIWYNFYEVEVVKVIRKYSSK
ncbi:MAG: antibiotic biosynthesis monooxygenase family protein [Neptuniibacter sp.]